MARNRRNDYNINVNSVQILPNTNKRLERYIFRGMTQGEDENVNNFMARLFSQVSKCGYPDDALEEHVIQQIIEGCQSKQLKRDLLSFEKLTLGEAIARGRQLEKIEKYGQQTHQPTPSAARFQQGQKKNKTVEDRMCSDCGETGHASKDLRCLAMTQICRYCGVVGHFKVKCQKKMFDDNYNASLNLTSSRGLKGIRKPAKNSRYSPWNN